MDSGNERLCELMEERIGKLGIGDKELFTEAIRRLRSQDRSLSDTLVETTEKLIVLNDILDKVLADNIRQSKRIDELEHGERELHVYYDLEDSECGAVLKEGTNEYPVSVLQLAEMLEARRDGRMVILPKEGENGTEN